MFDFLPIMLCCSAHKIYLLCSRIRVVLSTIYIQICMNNTADNLKRLFY